MSTQAETAAPPPPSNSTIARWIHRAGFADERDFVLRVVQPALVGMIDGTVSSLAPIFAAAISSSSHTALLVGFATALGAGVSMGWSEALSDTGEQTGRGSAVVRGAITGGMTALGGHLPHAAVPDLQRAQSADRRRMRRRRRAVRDRLDQETLPGVSMRSSLLVVTVGGADRARDRRRHRIFLSRGSVSASRGVAWITPVARSG